VSTTLKESITHLIDNHREPANIAVNALQDVEKDRPNPESTDQIYGDEVGVVVKLTLAKAQFPSCAICQAMTTDAEPV